MVNHINIPNNAEQNIIPTQFLTRLDSNYGYGSIYVLTVAYIRAGMMTENSGNCNGFEMIIMRKNLNSKKRSNPITI
jgi:hypothetical protein